MSFKKKHHLPAIPLYTHTQETVYTHSYQRYTVLWEKPARAIRNSLYTHDQEEAIGEILIDDFVDLDCLTDSTWQVPHHRPQLTVMVSLIAQRWCAFLRLRSSVLCWDNEKRIKEDSFLLLLRSCPGPKWANGRRPRFSKADRGSSCSTLGSLLALGHKRNSSNLFMPENLSFR